MRILRGALPLLLTLLTVTAGWGQAPSPAPAGKPVAGNTAPPDAVILVLPLSNGQYVVSAGYSQAVKKDRAEAEMSQVLAAGGWQGERFSFETGAMTGVGKTMGIKAPQIATIQGFVKGDILGPDGTVALGPFLMGFRDWNSVQVTVATPKEFAYKGPRTFSNAKVEFTCDAKEGLLTCAAKIKDHRMDELTLPQYEDSAEMAAGAGTAEKASPGASLRLWAIIGASLVVGVVVFLLARRAIAR